MSKNLQNIDNIFKDALDEHLESAPPGVWDAVNNDLDKKQAVLFREKYYKLKRLAVAALLIIFLGVAGMIYFVSNNKKGNSIETLAGADAKRKTLLNKPTADKTGDNSNATGEAGVTNADKNATNSLSSSEEKSNQASDKLTAESDSKSTAAAKKENDASNTAFKNETTAVSPLDAKANNNSSKSEKIKSTTSPTNNHLEETTATNNQPSIASPLNTLANNNISKSVKIEPGALSTNNQSEETIATVNNTAVNNNAIVKAKTGNGQKSTLSNKSLIAQSTKSSRKNNAGVNNNENASAGKTTEEIEQSNVLPDGAAFVAAKKTPNPLGPYFYQSPLLIDRVIAPSPVANNSSTGTLNNSLVLNNTKGEKPKPTAKKGVGNHPMALTVFASPNHSFTRLENDDMLATQFRNKKVAEREETQGSSYSLGALFSYGLNKNLSLQTGVVYSSATTNISPKTIYARPDNFGHTRYEFNCSSGSSFIDSKTGTAPAVGDSVKVMGSSSTVSYLGIPVALSYAIRMGRFSLNPGIGLSVNFLTSGEASTHFGMPWVGQKERTPIDGLKKAYVDASVGLGAEYAINKRISLSVRPLLRWALSSTNKNTPIRNYQNYVSFESGFKISL
ncbi:MAG: hypothetical protein QM726_22775 [Chitinophagaceae bacterium]